MSKEEGRAVTKAAGHRTSQYSASITVQKEPTPLRDVNGQTKSTFQSIAEAALDVATDEGCTVAESGDELPACRVQLLN